MKRLLLTLLASLSIQLAFAQPSNLVINVLLPRQNFFAGGASYSDTTNVQALTNIDGYFYGSNMVTSGGSITRWQFNPNIVIGTNYVIGLQVLTTNITLSQNLSATYSMKLYTNNGNIPYYTSDISSSTWANLLGYAPTSNTNIAIVRVTNNLPANALLQKTNFTYGTVSYRVGPDASSTISKWIVGGYIEFR